MKMHIDNEEVFGSDLSGAVDFSLKASSKAFMVLSKNTYQYCERACVREYSCNATDTHKEAGTLDRPFDIHLPTAIEPYFSVRDYGTGIPSKKELEQLFTVYFESTKDQTNDYIGSFGLGAKSAYSYTDTFTIVNYYNGRAYGFTAFVQNSMPKMVQIFDEPTHEDNGLKITIPVKEKDIQTWHREAQFVLRHFGEHKPNINAIEINYFPSFDNYYVCNGRDNDSYVVYAIMGKIQYPIPYEYVRGTWLEAVNRQHQTIYINFELGDLDLMPSREEVHLSIETKANIEKRIAEINEMMLEKVKEKIANIKTERKLAQFMSEYSSTQRNIISKMGKIGQWDDPVAIYNKFVNAGKDSPNDVEGQVYTLYRTRHTISKLRPAFVSSQYNITHFVWMHKEDITCLIDDTDKPKLRALTLNGMVQEYGINKKVLVFRQNNEKHMETFEYIKQYYDDSEMTVIKVSEADDLRAKAVKPEKTERTQREATPKLPNVYIMEKIGDSWHKTSHHMKAAEIRELSGLHMFRVGDAFESRSRQSIYNENTLHTALDYFGVTKYIITRNETQKYLVDEQLECALEFVRGKLADLAKKVKTNHLGYGEYLGVITMLFHDDELERCVPEFIDRLYGRHYNKEVSKLLLHTRWIMDEETKKICDEKFTAANERIKAVCAKFKENSPLLYDIVDNWYRILHNDKRAQDFMKLVKNVKF